MKFLGCLLKIDVLPIACFYDHSMGGGMLAMATKRL